MQTRSKRKEREDDIHGTSFNVELWTFWPIDWKSKEREEMEENKYNGLNSLSRL